MCVLLSDYIFISSLRFTSTWTPSLYRAPRKSIGIFGAGMSRDTFLAGKNCSMIIEKKIWMSRWPWRWQNTWLNTFANTCVNAYQINVQIQILDSREPGRPRGRPAHPSRAFSLKKEKNETNFFFKTWIEKRESNKIFAHYMKENSGEKRRPQEEKFNESQNRECSAKTEFIFKKSIADVTKAPSFSLLLTLFALGGDTPGV